jgi:hypothetical protein
MRLPRGVGIRHHRLEPWPCVKGPKRGVPATSDSLTYACIRTSHAGLPRPQKATLPPTPRAQRKDRTGEDWEAACRENRVQNCLQAKQSMKHNRHALIDDSGIAYHISEAKYSN